MIERKKYLDALIKKKWNDRIKIITGIRRCGKSTLLFDLFKEHLLKTGVKEKNIVTIQLDDDKYAELRDADRLSDYIRNTIGKSKEQYYVLIDEIQYAITKEELLQKDAPVKLYSVLNGFLHLKNIDVYVTGSNSKI